MRFKVLCGRFDDRGAGRIYEQGEVVESRQRLDVIFKNAFEILDAPPADPEDVVVPEPLGTFSNPLKLKRRGSRYQIINEVTGEVITDRLFTKSESTRLFIEHDFTKPWPAPTMWDGQTVFILGGGSSLKDMDLAPIHDGRVIGVNDAYLLGTWVDICFFGDFHWLQHHKDDFRLWPGLKVTNQPQCLGTEGIYAMARRSRGWGEPHELAWGLNSGLSACYLACQLGAEQVVLLGFDMALGSDGSSNWHPNNLNENNERTYKGFHYCFELFKLDLEQKFSNVKVVNATPDSKLEVFPKVSLDEVLAG